MAGNAPTVRDSISAYYASDTRNIFVGALFVIGFFLFAYRGHDKNDDRVGDVAFVAALGVALFPSTKAGWIALVHYISAFAFFCSLSYFSLCLFTKGANRRRNVAYRVCGTAMLVCIAAIALLKLTTLEERLSWTPVFWLEAVLVWAFGISWFVKGKALRAVGL